MTYRITNTTTFTKNLGEYTLEGYIATINYQDISLLYPELSESAWETVKTEILEYISLPLLTVGEVSGLISYTEDLSADHGIITLEFATEADYLSYVEAQVAKGPVHGIMVDFGPFTEQTFDFTLTENIFYNNQTLEIGRYLNIQYAIHRGAIKKCIHEMI
jgi:hypothetical protein